MEFSRHISRRLHEEHAATLALWGRLEQLLLAKGRETEARAVMREAAASLDQEVTRHFGFEEGELFPRLADAGEGDIAQLLAEEHGVIREAAFEFRSVLDANGDFQQLKALALELAERLVSHVQKEEMSLLPALDDLVDEDADSELFTAYIASS